MGKSISKAKRYEEPDVEVVLVEVRLKKETRGITVVDDKLFLVDSVDPAVKAFDSSTLTPLYHIYIPNMKDPKGLASCSYNKALYLSDWHLESIHKVDLASKKIKRWALGENYWPQGLSVTLEYNVLVAVWIRHKGMGTNGESKVLEYTSDGQLIREIALHKSIRNVWQIVQLSSDQFVIRHGWITGLHRLCVINSEGQIIKSYGGKGGLSDRQLYDPCSLTIDRDSGLLFVADGINSHRVQMFTTDMKFIRVIHCTKKIKHSMSLNFDTVSNKLFIDDSCDVEGMDPQLCVLTVLNDRVFIAYKEKNFILVYNSYTMAGQQRINIPDMKDPHGLAACSHNKSLYISDYGFDCIHRVNLDDNTLTKWKLKENYKPHGLSMTADQKFLITLVTLALYGLDMRGKSKCNIVTYTTDGQMVKDIALDTVEGWQTVRFSSDKFIVCHGGWGSKVHKLSIVNSEGQIIKSHGEEEGNGFNQLSDPHALTIDHNRGLVFVADLGNNRVLLFSTDLTLLGQVQTPKDFRSPSGVYFDSDSDRLFIVEERTGRVTIICSPE